MTQRQRPVAAGPRFLQLAVTKCGPGSGKLARPAPQSSCKGNMACTGEGSSPNHNPVQKVQSSPAMDPELATSRRNDCVKDQPETSETQHCGGVDLKEPRGSIATMSPGEMEAYAVLFIVLLIAGNVI